MEFHIPTKSLNAKQTCQIISVGKKMKLIKIVLVLARNKCLSTKNSTSPTKKSVSLSLPGLNHEEVGCTPSGLNQSKVSK